MQLSTRFEEACVFALHLHAQQKRKGSEIPYVAHLFGVSSIVIENGGDEDEAIAALLHDAVEDQGGEATLLEIRSRFGERVAEIVEGCTQHTEMASWRARKEAYVAHIRGATASVRLVSAADKLHNARAIWHDYQILGEQVWIRFKAGKEGTLWYYRAVTDALRAAGSSPLTEDLDEVVRRIEQEQAH